MEKIVHDLLTALGENPNREGLQKTPERFVKALKYLTSGHETDPEAVLSKGVFHESYSDMVVVKDIDFFSLCEHHLLPFFGKVHVAYMPNGKIVGLSKIPRVVNLYARRLQVQERLTEQISNLLHKVVEPKGVGVVMEAYHLCMMMRGVEKQRSYTITSSMTGCFREDLKVRQEFMDLIARDLKS